MIPRTIHYCWFGDRSLPDAHKAFIDGWQSLMPGYRFVFWNEENSPMEREYLREAYQARRWVNLANFIRLYSVYHHGGIYLDTDVEVVRSFDPLLSKSKCFFGYQISLREHAGNNVNNAVFGAEAHHPFVKKMLEAIEILYDGLETENLSGPHLTTFMLRSQGLLENTDDGMSDDVRVYPFHYFYPYSWLETFDPGCVTEDTYAVHHWFGSWSAPARPTSRFAVLRRIIRRGWPWRSMGDPPVSG